MFGDLLSRFPTPHELCYWRALTAVLLAKHSMSCLDIVMPPVWEQLQLNQSLCLNLVSITPSILCVLVTLGLLCVDPLASVTFGLSHASSEVELIALTQCLRAMLQ
jgi:hypothetical protein